MSRRGAWMWVAVVLAATIEGTPSTPLAQVVGDSVNMVSGTDWPGGDPFLQRQNEPSIAVSSANPNHLLAGANDYRSVDLPTVLNAETKMAADAWQGVFKSYDGGLTWKSYLMPGYPLDPFSADRNTTGSTPGAGGFPGVSPMRTACTTPANPGAVCNAAADPVVRAGTDGMFYFTGITFARGTDGGAVVINRFIDLNDKEDGNPLAGTDPIKWIDAKVIDQSNGAYFSDKPWIAVDIPRTVGDQPPKDCDIWGYDPMFPGDKTKARFHRNFRGGAVYLIWSRIYAPAKAGDPETADVMFTRSLDCFETWDPPRKMNDDNSKASQGGVLSVDPRTGDVYAAWRRFAFPPTATSAAQDDAIFASRTFSKGRKFTKPHLLTSVTPFDQGQGLQRFRTEAFPTIASSVDQTGTLSWTHVAWAQRQPNGDSRIVVSLVPVAPPPPSGDEADDDCSGWKIPAIPIDDGSVSDDFGHSLSRGHQFMPQLTFSQGRLVAVWYDSRVNHTRSYFTQNLVNGQWAPTADGRWYREEWGPMGERAWAADPLAWAPTEVSDDTLVTRSTIEVRMATAVPASQPTFGKSVAVSRMPFGERGDEAIPSELDLARDITDAVGDVLYFRPFGFGGGHIDLVEPKFPYRPATTGKVTLKKLQGLQANAPNLPMFKNGTRSFIGDYIDIQGPMFVSTPTGWRFNTEFTSSPVFHAVWTSNQDVVPPPIDPATGVPDWTKYTPVGPGSARVSKVTGAAEVPLCDPLLTGSRNQNVYTARISEGLFVSSPQNAKVLLGSTPSSFVVSAYNATSTDRVFRFSFQPVAAGVTAGFGVARTATVDVTIRAQSTASQTAFLTLSGGTNPATTIVNVQELNATGSPLSGSVTLNPPGVVFSLTALDAGERLGVQVGAASVANASLVNASLANASLVNASLANAALYAASLANAATCAASLANASLVNASLCNASLANASLVNASLANASLANASLCNASLVNASLCNASLANASLANASLVNASLANASLANASLANASLANVNVANASLANASLANASLANASLVNASISDLNYTVENTGNTAQAFDLSLATNAPAGTGPVQVIVSKSYSRPVAMGCELREQPDNRVLVNAGTVDPTNKNLGTLATFALAPGEKLQVTLRSLTDVQGVVDLGNQVAPVVSPQGDPTQKVQALVVTTTVDGPATVGSTFTLPLVSTGGKGATKWSCLDANQVPVGDCAGLLPDGLSLSGNVISGKPTKAFASFSFIVQVQDESVPPTVTQKLFTLTVNPGATTTTLAPSKAAVVFGETITLGATVDPAGPPAPTGSVAFSENGAPLGTRVIASGVASYGPFAPGAVGEHLYGASYLTDGNWLGSDSASASVNVSKAPTAIGLAVTSGGGSAGSSTYGDVASFTATVSVLAPGAGTPTGSVEFRDGPTVIGTVALTGATATFTTTALGGGSHTLTATYTGDASFLASGASAPVTQTVAKAVTPLSVTVTVLASTYPGSALVKATVTTTGPAAPSRPVEFWDGAFSLGTATIVNGVAAIQVGLGAGTHSLGASYPGDGNYLPVTFNTTTLAIDPVYADAVVIAKAPVTNLLTGPATSPTFGDSVTFAATITSPSGAAVTESGAAVAFYRDTTIPLATKAVDSTGKATLATTALPGGSHQVSACFGGSASFAPQSYLCDPANPAGCIPCAYVSQTINPASSTASWGTLPTSVVTGASVTLTCTVAAGTAAAGAVAFPSGTVNFNDTTGSGTTLSTALITSFSLGASSCTSPSCVCAGGTCTLTWSTSFTTATSHDLTCEYKGDNNYLPSGQTTGLPVYSPGTTTSLTVTPNPAYDDKPITFTAKVAASSGTTVPTGTVSFLDGTKSIGTATLSTTGVATLTLKSMSEGTHSITATYGGSASFASSTSPVVSLKVLEDYSCKAYAKPLASGGTVSAPTKSGSFTYGTKVAVKWSFQKPTGVYVTRLTAVKALNAVFDSACTGKPLAGAVSIALYDPVKGATTGSTFTYDATTNQYYLNWDTTKASKGCWDIVLTPDNGIPQVATVVQLK